MQNEKINKYDKTFMRDAINWSEESYAIRKKVGCVITRDDHHIGNGYNGTVPGQSNKCEHIIGASCNNCAAIVSSNAIGYKCENCNDGIIVADLKTNDNVIHAEVNAIAFCSKHGISLDGATIYITLSPCADCANLIHAVGIKRVVYLDEYKSLEGVEKLRRYGVSVEKLIIKGE